MCAYYNVRVSCYGEATIIEVSYQQKAMKEEQEVAEEEQQSKTEAEKSSIKASIKLLKNNKSKHLRRIKVINKENSLLEQYGKCIDDVSIKLNCTSH